MAARLEAPQAGGRPACDCHSSCAPARAGLAAVAELATISAGYLGYALVRLAIHATAGENGLIASANLSTIVLMPRATNKAPRPVTPQLRLSMQDRFCGAPVA
jgi:hypothetical protein